MIAAAAERHAAAPLTRGWTPPSQCHRVGHAGCPAHAGMDPMMSFVVQGLNRLPRSRGDGPWETQRDVVLAEAAPLTRGWTLLHLDARELPQGCPAHAGMDPARSRRLSGSWRLPRSRGDGPERYRDLWTYNGAAPLTRGWTRGPPVVPAHGLGCPAHAGMDPSDSPTYSSRFGLPRSRGDGPLG